MIFYSYMTIEQGKSFVYLRVDSWGWHELDLVGNNTVEEVKSVRNFDKEFQNQVEEYLQEPAGTHNQVSEKDRHDKMEKRETRLDSNQ